MDVPDDLVVVVLELVALHRVGVDGHGLAGNEARERLYVLGGRRRGSNDRVLADHGALVHRRPHGHVGALEYARDAADDRILGQDRAIANEGVVSHIGTMHQEHVPADLRDVAVAGLVDRHVFADRAVVADLHGLARGVVPPLPDLVAGGADAGEPVRPDSRCPGVSARP